MNRVVDVTRVQLLEWRGWLGWAWGVLALSFAVNLVISGALTRADLAGENLTGGLVSIYFVILIAFAGVITQFFPFCLAMGVTRRVFYAASGLLALGLALVYGTAIYVLRIIEDATGGWWVELHFFGPRIVRQDGPFLQWLVYVVPFLLVAGLGLAAGVLTKRWGTNGWLVVVAVSIVVFGALGAIATITDSWPGIGSWLLDQSTVGIFAGWFAVIAVAALVLGYLALRRAPA